jgi:hypothetical protein
MLFCIVAQWSWSSFCRACGILRLADLVHLLLHLLHVLLRLRHLLVELRCAGAAGFACPLLPAGASAATSDGRRHRQHAAVPKRNQSSHFFLLP